MPSSQRAEVVAVTLEPHPNADRLSIVRIDDYTCVTGTEQWTGIPLRACFIQPDTLVDTTRPEFQFLLPQARSDGKCRIKAKKLRGVNSFGLLVPTEAEVGTDLWDSLQLEHWNPPEKETGFQVSDKLMISCKPLAIPTELSYVEKYDLESGNKYARSLMIEGEPCIITEKIHGQNGRYCYTGDTQYAGSRTGWKNPVLDFSHITAEWLSHHGVEEAKAAEILVKLRAAEAHGSTENWWVAYEAQPEIGIFCRANPGYLLFGEVYGPKVQGGFPYGAKGPRFLCFDVLSPTGFLPPLEARALAAASGVPCVPLMHHGPYSTELCLQLAEGRSTLDSHIREGVVVEPCDGRVNKYGRVKFKFVGAGYLERSKDAI